MKASVSFSGTPPSVGVHAAEVDLGNSFPLIGGESIPFHGFGLVLRHTLTNLVHEAEVGLGRGIPLIGLPENFRERIQVLPKRPRRD